MVRNALSHLQVGLHATPNHYVYFSVLGARNAELGSGGWDLMLAAIAKKWNYQSRRLAAEAPVKTYLGNFSC